MKRSQLGNSGLEVTRICLGTMTWGLQNTEAEGHEQMDYALDQDINFFDTAEAYAVPPSAETYGSTETIIGTWFAKRKNREQVILATKAAGASFPYIRGGSKIDGKQVAAAIDGSLKRLQTDYIDLYQLHWPNRANPHFGKHWAGAYDVTKNDYAAEEDTISDVLDVIEEAKKAGKVRHFGLSDDTPWGLMTYNRIAREKGVATLTSLQNEYSLIHRKDEPFITEVCAAENIAYLPWSPLAGGALSGKYLGGARPEGARWSLDKRKLFRDTEGTEAAIRAYKNLAETHGLDVTQMALKWVDMQPFVTSTIIGATSMEQLKSNIKAFELSLSDEVLSGISEIYAGNPMPF
ncbi:MAG: aldo/keto reductase [Pseudobdellovibrionaceae bacterium]